MAIDSSHLKFLAEQTTVARDRLLEAIFTRTDIPQEVRELAIEFCKANNRQADENSRLIKLLEEPSNRL